VNEIFRMSGCFAIAAPSAPGPLREFRTPGGSASLSTSMSLSVESGVNEAGFEITAFPTRMAGASFQERIASGKFQGVMVATTPRGLRRSFTRLASSSLRTFSSKSRLANAANIAAAMATSVLASSMGLPCSCTSTRAMSWRFFWIRPAPSSSAFRRTATSWRHQLFCAAFAAARACSSSSGPERGAVSTTSRVAGLRTSNVSFAVVR
jgi:hypothetical protein